MIKAVIFDCFGVLTVDLWKEFTATLPNELRNQASDINHSYDRGEMDEKEFLRQVEKLTGKKPWEIEDVRNSDGTKNKELLDYIVILKKNYKIGMLSNVASNWIRDYFLTAEEQSLFDQMIFSFEAKMIKPDPRIYHLVAGRLGVDASECVFIDDVERFCTAAEQEGMKAILYQNYDQTKADLEKILAKG